ncbi:MAG: DUF2637 domain-containing protein, partial [Galactobacter sp.]
GRGVLWTAVAATVVIAIGAFVLSFASLTDLAVRSGIDSTLAWIWPIIVDGLIVAATVAIVALNGHGRRAMVYPWTLLFFGAIVSTAANATHAILSVDRSPDIPAVVAALVAAMPPVVLLLITHLTVHMFQKRAEVAQEIEASQAETAATDEAYYRELQMRRAEAAASLARALETNDDDREHRASVESLEAELAALQEEADAHVERESGGFFPSATSAVDLPGPSRVN